MKRRRFVALVGSALAAPLVTAQQPGKVYRIGFLTPDSAGRARTDFRNASLEDGLRELGHVVGGNLFIEYRSAQGVADRLPALAQELVGLNVDLIVTQTTVAAVSAKAVTAKIPIVMTVASSVVERGLVASLGRPGGNITGLIWDVEPEINGKRLQLLKEAVPDASRIAILWDMAIAPKPESKKAVEDAGAALRVQLLWPEISDDLEGVFATVVRERAHAVFVGGGLRLFGFRQKIVELAAKNRLPAIFEELQNVEAGGLMSFAPDGRGHMKAAAKYVDRILKGAKPADLPIERPTRLDLVINLKTAKALGLKLPQSLLLRADRVIE
jgi:putative ABC transport system substrate-binding protein